MRDDGSGLRPETSEGDHDQPGDGRLGRQAAGGGERVE
jgi:hypothetical protein